MIIYIKQNVSEADILKLINYFKSEHYETETVDLDLFLSNNGGNVKKYMINDVKCMECVMNMFNKTRSYAFYVSFCPCYHYDSHSEHIQ